MLIGIPLGLSSRRGGKSAGFVVTIALVFIYYFLSLIGNSLAREGKVPVFAGVWAANILFRLLRPAAVAANGSGGGALGTQFAAIVSRFKSTQLLAPRSRRAARKIAPRTSAGAFPSFSTTMCCANF